MPVSAEVDLEYRDLLDIALGLTPPVSGRVLFRGRDWRDMNAFESSAARGDMGVVFEQRGWISSLTVIENIVLRVRHHTTRSEQDIHAEVAELLEVAGLAGSVDLELRPDVVSHRRLRPLEWVRACMGAPAVILLAYPERGAASTSVSSLARLLDYILDNGSAVLLVTGRGDLLEHARDHRNALDRATSFGVGVSGNGVGV